MSFFDALRHRLHVLRRGDEYADEQAREVAFHLELAAHEHSPFQVDHPAAKCAARREFGNVTRYRELAREVSPLAWMDRIHQDLGYAWRGLRREPAFTVAVMVTLGLGVGFSGAAFSLLDRVFIRSPEGVAAPRELRRLYLETSRPRIPLDWSPRNHRERWVIEQFPIEVYETMASVIGGESVAAYAPSHGVRIEDPGEFAAKRSYVSANYFGVLGVQLQLGTTFRPEDEQRGYPVVVISDDLWHRVFKGDAAVIGRRVRIAYGTCRPQTPTTGRGRVAEAPGTTEYDDGRPLVGSFSPFGFPWLSLPPSRHCGEPFTVIGVAAQGFSGADLDRVDLWSPLPYELDVQAVARVPAESALLPSEGEIAARLFPKEASADPLYVLQRVCRCRRRPPDPGFAYDGVYTWPGDGVYTWPGVIDGPIVEARGPLATTPEASNALRVAAVSLLVLLIACANVTTLLLLRSARRGREIALRRALGVARSRLGQQVLVESLLLVVLGGIASLIVVYWGGMLLPRMLFPSIDWSGRAVDFRGIILVAALSIAAAVLTGVVPAIGVANPDVMVLLRRGPHDIESRGARVRSLLVILQSALSVVLLVGATLLVRTLRNVESIGVGYDPRDMAFGGMSFRFGAELFSVLSAVALVVAAVGIYSVASYAMTQRTHELGVRLALGARTEDVFRLAAVHGLADLVAGVALGAFVAAELAPFLASLLFGVRPTDMPTLWGAALAVLAVGTLARIVPAWRASRIDPVRTLAAD